MNSTPSPDGTLLIARMFVPRAGPDSSQGIESVEVVNGCHELLAEDTVSSLGPGPLSPVPLSFGPFSMMYVPFLAVLLSTPLLSMSWSVLLLSSWNQWLPSSQHDRMWYSLVESLLVQYVPKARVPLTEGLGL